MGEIKTLVDQVYGPVKSRRLGTSLGINTSPKERVVCNFGCVYCQYAIDDNRRKNEGIRASKFPEVNEIIEQLKKRLQSKEKYDSITFAGHGEPTLHPQFDKIVTEVKKLRDKYRPSTPLSIFTNASYVAEVDLSKFDNVYLKLDAGNEETFRKVNEPRTKINLKNIVSKLARLKVKRKIIQSMFFEGEITNLDEQNINDYIAQLEKIQPKEVNLYTILYEPDTRKAKPASMKKLKSIAKRIREKINCEIKCYTDLSM